MLELLLSTALSNPRNKRLPVVSDLLLDKVSKLHEVQGQGLGVLGRIDWMLPGTGGCKYHVILVTEFGLDCSGSAL